MNKIKVILAAILLTGSNAFAAFVNDPAPAFTLKDLSGNSISLSDYKGKVVFVNFWASWCPPCKKEFPELNTLSQELKDKPFSMLAINLDKSQSRVESFLSKLATPANAMKVLLDPDQKIVAAYVARSMPSSFIIDQSGLIRYVHFGYSEQDPQKWRDEINKLISEVPSNEPISKSQAEPKSKKSLKK